MPVPGYAQHIQISFLDTMSRARTNAAPQQAAASSPDFDISFDDILDVVNPLQHLPVVSTFYRKYSGDQIKPLEKIAGDTLYGGPMGFASSLADLAFEKITGKNFGDTVLAFALGEDGKQSAPSAASAVATPFAGAATSGSSDRSSPAMPGVLNRAPFYASPDSNNLPSPATETLLTAPSIQNADLDRGSLDTLAVSLNGKNFESALRTRTLDAYRWTAGLQTQLPAVFAAQ